MKKKEIFSEEEELENNFLTKLKTKNVPINKFKELSTRVYKETNNKSSNKEDNIKNKVKIQDELKLAKNINTKDDKDDKENKYKIQDELKLEIKPITKDDNKDKIQDELKLEIKPITKDDNKYKIQDELKLEIKPITKDDNKYKIQDKLKLEIKPITKDDNKDKIQDELKLEIKPITKDDNKDKIQDELKLEIKPITKDDNKDLIIPNINTDENKNNILIPNTINNMLNKDTKKNTINNKGMIVKENYNSENKFEVIIIGIPHNATVKELIKDFESYGKIKNVKIIKNNDGEPKGKAFIKFENESGMNNLLFYSSVIYKGNIVAIEKTILRNYRENDNNLKYNYNKKTNKIFIKNLCYKVSDIQLKNEFLEFGKIVKAKIFRNKNKSSKGIGLIEFQNIEIAERSLQKNGSLINRRQIRINFYNN